MPRLPSSGIESRAFVASVSKYVYNLIVLVTIGFHD